MRRVFAALIALMLALSARAETNPTDAFKGRWRASGDAGAEMKILPEYLDEEGQDDLAVYPIDLFWSPEPDRQVMWTMTARYNSKKRRLEYKDGTMIEGGAIVLSGTKGYVQLDGAGRLQWTDSREADAQQLSFARILAPTPTPEDFADGYFRVVAALERGSGAARKAAQTIVTVLQFAESREMWNADGEAMQANLEAAWDSLADDERARFDAVFDAGVSDPADEAFDDYAAVKKVFESAGVGQEMARLAASNEARLSWEFLSSATLNMGNLEDGIREDAEG